MVMRMKGHQLPGLDLQNRLILIYGRNNILN